MGRRIAAGVAALGCRNLRLVAEGAGRQLQLVDAVSRAAARDRTEGRLVERARRQLQLVGTVRQSLGGRRGSRVLVLLEGLAEEAAADGRRCRGGDGVRL